MAQKGNIYNFDAEDSDIPTETASTPVVSAPESSSTPFVSALSDLSVLPEGERSRFQKMNSALDSLWASYHPDQPAPDHSSPEYLKFVQQNALNLNWDNFADQNAAEWERAAPIKQQLSEYLNNNQFDKAIKFAEENNASKYLQDFRELRQLRKPFTQQEAAAYLSAVPESWHRKREIYDPSSALANTVNNWNGQATGYPDFQSGLINPEGKDAAIFKGLVTAALGAGVAFGAAPLLTGALGGLGGGSLSAAQAAALNLPANGLLGSIGSAAAKSAIGSAISTAIQGGDVGDILKAAAISGATAGLGAGATGALNKELVSLGLPPNIAKAATNAAISAGTAAVRGQDPLQAGVISGFGTYVSLEGQNLASDFAAKTGISEELAKQLVGPAGSALATSVVGGNALAAAANEYVNENSQKLIDAGKEKFRELFPETAGNIDSFSTQVRGYVDGIKGSLGFNSEDAPKSGGLPSDNSDLPTINVTGSRNPIIPIDSLFGGYSKSSLDGGLPSVAETTPVAETSPVKPSDNLEELTVNAQRSVENPINIFGSTTTSSGGLPPVEAPPVELPLEEVAVTAKKEPAPINVVGQKPIVADDGLEELTVTGKKDPDQINVVGQYPTRGADGLEELAVTGTRPKTDLGNYALNPFTPTVETSTPALNLPSNIGITVKKPSTGGMDSESGLANQSPWLDTSDQFLKGKVSNQGGTKLAQLKQIFEQLDPSLQGVLSDRGYGAVPAASGGLIQAYADGGTTCCFKAVLKDLAPNFAPCTQEMLAPLSVRRTQPFTLAKLTHIKPYIAPTGSMGGMAKGGLPSKYSEAAPEGHEPEFITGLTGYYAQGGGTGQSDDIPAMLHDGDYVMDADTVAAFGDGSSKAGAEVMDRFRMEIPHESNAQGKAVPAKIADGEYVFPAAFVTALGGGDNKQGSKMLDEMRERLRAQKRSAPTSKIPPKAKSPLDYLRKG